MGITEEFGVDDDNDIDNDLRRLNDSDHFCPDLSFIYSDAEENTKNEMAELYSYTENREFQLNERTYEELQCFWKLALESPERLWTLQTETHRKNIIMKLMDKLELANKVERMKAARSLLYLAQGCFGEMKTEEQQIEMATQNVMMLYELGVFSAFVELLSYEIENSTTSNISIKVAVSLVDSTDLRIILSMLYIITEIMRTEGNSDKSRYINIVENFRQEISYSINGDEESNLLAVKLLSMVTRFCSGTAPHFPMKKVLLLLWKVSLVSLGGMDTLRKLKNEHREAVGLPKNLEDTLDVAKTMRASSPPASASDILDNQQGYASKRSHRPFRRSLATLNSLDDDQNDSIDSNDYFSNSTDGVDGNDDDKQSTNDDNLPGLDGVEDERPTSSRSHLDGNLPNISKPGLPWTPKVRQKDVNQFLDVTRTKFIGYTFLDDHESMAGLPNSIYEGVKVLKKHLYTSLADYQISKEQQITKNPFSIREGEIKQTPSEILYAALLPNLPQYMISLLKILLAAAPTSKAKTESINIMADVLPDLLPITVTESTKLGVDVNRHKEIIVKSISAILLLYLKHFKLNHIYQFEFVAQHLVFANCIPLILKFFNQNIMGYIGSATAIPIMEFPRCVIGEQQKLTSECFVTSGNNNDCCHSHYSWRNTFSCINLLRILNKLTKWKHSRIMMLVVFKSTPILKKSLKVRHAMMQLYILKLLKMQTKYLGRQWRKSNMKTISAIYSKVRHRLGDDWAFGNDLDARPWDFQAEECNLRANVDRFNNRRYLLPCAANNGQHGGTNNRPIYNNTYSTGDFCYTEQDFLNINNYSNTASGLINNNLAVQGGNNNTADGVIGFSSSCIFSNQHDGNQLNNNVELSDEFKENYDIWLNQEVFNQEINWDSLILPVE